jgi:futalosine hydrolase
MSQIPPVKITIVAATKLEILPMLGQFHAKAGDFTGLYIASDHLHFLVTGMGMMNTAAHLALYCSNHERDFYINAGICGAFNRILSLGDVVQITSETYGDFGVENDDQFEDFFDLGFIDKKEDAFQYGLCEPILSVYHQQVNLPKATSITVNKVHGNVNTIKTIEDKYNADIENMEGLAFYYVLKLIQKPGIEIRAVSNYVEKRNKNNWEIELAVKHLNDEIVQLINKLKK